MRSKYGEIFRISPYSFQMRENADQNNSEYGHFFEVYLKNEKGLQKVDNNDIDALSRTFFSK